MSIYWPSTGLMCVNVGGARNSDTDQRCAAGLGTRLAREVYMFHFLAWNVVAVLDFTVFRRTKRVRYTYIIDTARLLLNSQNVCDK